MPALDTSLSPHRLRRLLLVIVPLALAAGLRLTHLGALEPFVDEGANILTSLDLRARAAFEPLPQGRPLLALEFQPVALFPGAPLVAARTMTVLAGLVAMGALAWVLRAIAGGRAALLACWLMAVSPFAVWHERLALQDPVVSALLALMLAMLTAVSRPAADQTASAIGFAVAGLLFGVAFLTKISAVFALPWLALVFVAVRRHFGRRIFVSDLGWLAAGALLPVLLLGRDLPQLGSALRRYDALPVLSTAQGVTAAVGASLTAALARFSQWLEWYRGYGGWPLALLLVATVTALVVRRDRLALWSGAGWLLTLLSGAALYNNPHARYAHPDYLPLILCCAASLGATGSGKIPGERSAQILRRAFAASLIALGGWGFASWKIAADPRHPPIPADEIAQYVTGPWSGAGIAEVNRFLADRLARDPDRSSIVITHRFLRPGCYALMLTSLGHPRLAVLPWPVYETTDLAGALAALRRSGTKPATDVFLLYEGSLYPAAPWLGQPGSGTSLVLDAPHGESERWRLFRCEF